MTEREVAGRGWLRRPLARLMLCGMLAASLQGCIEMAIGTAVMTSLAATDRRTIGAQTEDKAIPLKINKRLSGIATESDHVNVTSYNRKVLLTGEVRDDSVRAEVERIAAGVDGVEGVVNELVVDFTSSYAARLNDTQLTTRVKASLVNARDLHANAFKVVTERGVVYLLGRVTEREGQRAAEIASGVGGVQKVVKLFEYITEEELRQMTMVPGSATAGQGAEPAPAPAPAPVQNVAPLQEETAK